MAAGLRMKCREVKRWLVSSWTARELQINYCELLEAGSWGTGIIREPRVRVMQAVENHYQATASEETAVWEDLLRALVNWWLYESVMAL
jgi:hypothetical protein